jgi:hypothetical protein
MRRTLVALAVACFAVLGAAGCADNASTDSNNEPANEQPGGDGPEGSSGFNAPHACDLLTTEIASAVMGMPAQQGRTNADITRNGARYSTCGYTPADLSAPNLGVNLAMDAPVDESGVANVEGAFDAMTTIDPSATPVSGYGDRAVWSPNTGQLVVMKNGLWMSFMVGEGIDVTSWTLDDAKRLADALLPTL